MRAAVHSFVQHGIDGTTTKAIARAAGVAEGALYRHFKGKDELAWYIFSTHLNQFATVLMGKVLGERSVEDRIRVFVSECFSAFEEDRDLFTYLILTEHNELKKYPVNYKHPGHVAVRLIEDGQKEGTVRAGEPYLLGALFVGAIIRACVVRMYGRIPKDLRECGAEVTDALWSMLKANP